MNGFDHPTAIAIVTVIAVMILTSLIQWTFLLRLKKHHTDQWCHAGNPTIWTDQSLISAWPTVRYLQKKEYTSSGNVSGIRFCNFFRFPMVYGYWSTVLVFIAGAIIGVLNGWPPGWN